MLLCPSDRPPHTAEKPAVGNVTLPFPPLHLPPTDQPTLKWCTPKLSHYCSALICKRGMEVASQQQAAARYLLCPHGECIVAFLERFTSGLIPKGKLLHAPRGTHSGLISVCFLSPDPSSHLGGPTNVMVGRRKCWWCTELQRGWQSSR